MAVACGGSASSVTTAVGADGDTVEVGVEGGSTEVDIPEGALSQEVEITVEEVESGSVAELPPGTSSPVAPVAFTPHGTKFDVPVVISFTVNGGVPVGAVIGRLDDENDTTWELLEGAISGNVISTEVTTFSIYSVIEGTCVDNDEDGICNSEDACPDSAENDDDGNGTCDAEEGRISGVITEAATPIPAGVTVTLFNGQQQIAGTTTTNASGEYFFGNLAAGAYVASVADQNACLFGSSVETTVAVGEHKTANFTAGCN